MLDAYTRRNGGRIPALRPWVRRSYHMRQVVLQEGYCFKFTKSHSRRPIRKHLLALLFLLYVGEDERAYLDEIVEPLELQLFLPDF
jgi:hypothetical protein